MQTKIADGETILFTGDSITGCGRAWPLGAGSGLGNGYVSLAEDRVHPNLTGHMIIARAFLDAMAG